MSSARAGGHPAPVSLVLASASPARLATLRNAGIEPIVEVSGVDESLVTETDPALLAGTLARLKAEEVVARRTGHFGGGRTLVLGCDSVLEFEGRPYGKPVTPGIATERLRALSGRTAVLHTGHHLIAADRAMSRSAVASTTVVFGTLSDAEIAAYVASGEPLAVAGAFTLDGLGGAFVERVEGDPHNVVGLSLPLVRRLARDLGVSWPALWNRA